MPLLRGVGGDIALPVGHERGYALKLSRRLAESIELRLPGVDEIGREAAVVALKLMASDKPRHQAAGARLAILLDNTVTRRAVVAVESIRSDRMADVAERTSDVGSLASVVRLIRETAVKPTPAPPETPQASCSQALARLDADASNAT